MLDEVRALLVLQDRDRRLMALAADLAKLPQDEARARGKLAKDEAAVVAAHEALMAEELKVKKVEMEIETRRTTIKRLKVQQFETRKNEEYRAFGHEIERYEGEVDGLETRELELMEEVDRLRALEKEARAGLERTRVMVEEDLGVIRERKVRMEAEHAEVVAERAGLAARAQGPALPLYERLMKNKAGLAVAPMAEGRCGGCHMKVIASTAIKAQAGQELTQCENCGRILYAAD